MNLSQVLAFLAPFEGLLKPELLNLEAQGKAELVGMLDKVTSPDLKLLLSCVIEAVDTFTKSEIANLG